MCAISGGRKTSGNSKERDNMILFDPTENRENSKIYGILTQVGKSMKGLERATGCDIAVLPDDISISEDALSDTRSEDICRTLLKITKREEVAEQYGLPILSIIKIINFMKAAQKGCLIQRKTNGDLLSSIPRLSGILEKMRLWTPTPWLLTTGSFESTDLGKVKVDKKRETDFAYVALLGALEAWQIRGGYYINMSDENPMIIRSWLLKQQKRANEEFSLKVVHFRRPPQQLIVNETDSDAWVSTLMTFEGIGQTLAENIGDFFGTLAASLCFLSDPTSSTWKDKPSGYGTIISQKARNRLGLGEKQRLEIVEDE